MKFKLEADCARDGGRIEKYSRTFTVPDVNAALDKVKEIGLEQGWADCAFERLQLFPIPG